MLTMLRYRRLTFQSFLISLGNLLTLTFQDQELFIGQRPLRARFSWRSTQSHYAFFTEKTILGTTIMSAYVGLAPHALRNYRSIVT
jgi:hypothetical protein